MARSALSFIRQLEADRKVWYAISPDGRPVVCVRKQYHSNEARRHKTAWHAIGSIRNEHFTDEVNQDELIDVGLAYFMGKGLAAGIKVR